ncbi:MAG: hypothetical protein KGN36_06070 [Acidobacteriota bacterium]|nr:hypothetical protein [Acidobacteriota bacterium]
MALMSIGGAAAAAGPDTPVTVFVSYDGDVPGSLVTSAMFRATKVFAATGVAVHFLPDEKDKAKRHGGVAVAIRIEMDPSGHVSGGALAHAQPYDNSAPIRIYYSRIRAYNSSVSREALLGYVLAHEVGHVLQGVVRHSEAGVMKAYWSAIDFDRMRVASLGFDRRDVELMRDGVARLAAALPTE